MTIAEKLRTEFPRICALFYALKREWKAYRAYNKAIKAVSVVVVPEPTNGWAQTVSERAGTFDYIHAGNIAFKLCHKTADEIEAVRAAEGGNRKQNG